MPNLGFNKSSNKKLEVIHMRCLRRILKIKWDDVWELKIKNVQVRENLKILIRLKISFRKEESIFLER